MLDRITRAHGHTLTDLLVMFGIVIQGPATLLVAPIAFYEMILAVWLIVKGFNPSAIAAKPAQMDMNNHIMATAKV